MSRRGLLLFAAMCVIWGVPYLLIRVAVGEISPATLVFVRTAIAAVILLPFVLARGGWRSIGGRWPALVAFAAVEVAMPWFFLSSAEQHITSALARPLISAVPRRGAAVAARDPEPFRSRLGSRARGAVHGGGIPIVLRVDRGDRAGAGDGDHVCEPGGRGDPRCCRPA